MKHQAKHWQINLILDGMDVSENLINQLRIESEEGAAKISEFALIPFAGPISISKWIGKTVKISYQRIDLHEVLFVGVVDEPVYDPITKVTTFTCSDQLQEQIQAFTKEEISHLIEGYGTEFDSNSNTDNWSYAQQQLSTTPACLDLDKNNQFILSPWISKPKTDFVFTEDDILYQSIEIKLANRRELHNQTDISIQYRYQRFKQREIQFDYHYALDFCEQLYRNSTLPNVDMIQQAIDGTGWLLKGKVEYEHQRGPGWVKCGDVTSAFMIREELRKYLVRDARFILAKRFVQTVTQNYQLSIRAPQSIQQFGEIKHELSQSLEVPADADKFVGVEKYQLPIQNSFLDLEGDYVLEKDDHAQLSAAIVTKLNQAKTEILKSHRNNLVTFKTPLNPFIERHHTAKLDSANVKAQGKVKHIVHECDFDQGSALTTITLAISRTDDDTKIDESSLNPPQNVSQLFSGEQIQRIELATHLGGKQGSVDHDESWSGYSGNEKPEPNGKLYPERFVITTPAIDKAQAPLDYNVRLEYVISIPNELLLLSA